MFAVIKTGGKQYRVAAEDVIKVEKVKGEPGEIVQFGEVLVVGGDDVTLGAPTVAGASVAAEVLEQGRGAEGHRLQEAPPQEFAPQARPPAGIHPGADHRNPDRRRQADRHRAGRSPSGSRSRLPQSADGDEPPRAAPKAKAQKPAPKAEASSKSRRSSRARNRTSRNRAPRARRSDDFVTKLDYITGD